MPGESKSARAEGYTLYIFFSNTVTPNSYYPPSITLFLFFLINLFKFFISFLQFVFLLISYVFLLSCKTFPSSKSDPLCKSDPFPHPDETISLIKNEIVLSLILQKTIKNKV